MILELHTSLILRYDIKQNYEMCIFTHPKRVVSSNFANNAISLVSKFISLYLMFISKDLDLISCCIGMICRKVVFKSLFSYLNLKSFIIFLCLFGPRLLHLIHYLMLHLTLQQDVSLPLLEGKPKKIKK